MPVTKILKLVQSQPGIHFEEIAKDLNIVPGRVLHTITRELNSQVTMANGLCTAKENSVAPRKEKTSQKKKASEQKLSAEKERMYFRLATNELDRLARENWSNILTLKNIHKETLHRTKSAGVRLAAKLAQRIRSLENGTQKNSKIKEAELSLLDLDSSPKLEPIAKKKSTILLKGRVAKMGEQVIESGKSHAKPKISEPQLNKSFAYDSLEALRKKLLDLTGRNRLLNFRHGRGGFVRVIDELPDQLQELLLTDAVLRFLPVPEPSKDELIEAGYIELDEDGQEVRLKKDPTAKEWAKYLGFQTSYELPLPTPDVTDEEKHQDVCIQTLLYPYEMETQLRGIRSKAQTAIEETGANILYLAFGFLEWYESNDSDIARHAPLYLVPTKLEKGSLDKARGTYSYTLQYTGEDIVTNLSLREKLKLDYGIALPELDENTTPDEYLTAVNERIVRNQPSWKVKRYCTLSMLNFGKLLMYLDLDPSRWPGGAGNITEHEIVKRFFSTNSSPGEGGSGFFEEYEIDDLDGVHEQYPLIDDADSSQHSALVDVIKGKNLVIEGPPGTGKSQTITNLIAAAIVQGKKVLFVAEKMAALQVVKNRLDKAGLGDFCLELHSHKTQKKKVYEEISHRLGKQGQYRSPSKIDVDIARYEDLKKQLNDHANLNNSNWKNTGHTIHKILTAATRYREKLSIDAMDVHPNGITGESFDGVTQTRILDDIRLYSSVYEQVRQQIGSDVDLSFHPWFGVNDTSIQLFDADSVRTQLQTWQEELTGLSHVSTEISELLSPDTDKFDRVTNLERVLVDVKSLPKLSGKEYLNALPDLDEQSVDEVEVYTLKFEKAYEYFDFLCNQFQTNVLNDQDKFESLEHALNSFNTAGIDSKLNLEEVFQLAKKLGSLNQQVVDLSDTLNDVVKQFGEGAGRFINESQEGIAELNQVVKISVELDPKLIAHRSLCFDEPELDELIPKLVVSLESLIPKNEVLKKLFVLDALPDSIVLKGLLNTVDSGGAFKWFKKDWRDARKAVKALSILPNAKFKGLACKLDELTSYQTEKEIFDTTLEYEKNLGVWFKGLDTNINDIGKLRAWYKRVRETYGVGFGPKVPVGQRLLDMDSNTLRGLQHLDSQGVCQRIDGILSAYDYLKDQLPHLDLFKSPTNILSDEHSGLGSVKAAIEVELNHCQSKVTKNVSVSDLSSLLERLGRFNLLADVLEQTSDLVSRLFGIDNVLSFEEPQKSLVSLEIMRKTIQIAGAVNRLDVTELSDAIRQQPTSELYNLLGEIGAKLSECLASVRAAKDHFVTRTSLDYGAWTQETGDKITDLRTRNENALTNPTWLSNWIDFIRCREDLSHKGFERIIAKVEKQQIGLNELEDVFALATYDLLAREIIKSQPSLAHFSGAKQNGIQKQFREYDQKLKTLQRERIAWEVSKNEVPIGASGGRVSNYTELSLIRNEANKKTRHVPVRQLTKRSGRALSALKPCFMMGPMSVAQYLEPGKVEFDLVVMDEASQIKPEDALGAIARGKQLVVVGDPKQLPPTNFFNKMIEQDEDDATAIEQSESILDVALPMFAARRLRWHYRSKHESLIAFSNQTFYNSDLVVFPSPHSKSDDYGIKFVPIKRGRFVNRRNIEEATVIAEAVMHHLLHRSEESLGVVAMSAEQREQIERSVEELSKENVEFRDALEENQLNDESLFIKNLENVQGDERDVIYISCTYGPQEAGATSMPQRFGPINSPMGGRRLNVLFTRSKKRMHIFSSMTDGHIRTSETSSSGIVALKNFLAFAQTGIMQQPKHTGLAPDSDFEISVADALKDAGFECEPQVGVAGFFIDLAVIDPGQPGRYLMGVECDGASYHSAKSARDRDRLRQEVLERLGWKIRRIWSTDWFKNPQAQIEPLVRELNKLKTPIRYEPEVVEEVEETEVEEINEIVHEVEEQYEQASLFNVEGMSLKDKLIKFDNDVINVESGGIDPAKRLLRPSMLEALDEFRPISKSEFQERIPSFLRSSIDGKQGRFLEQVLNIIAEDEMEEE